MIVTQLTRLHLQLFLLTGETGEQIDPGVVLIPKRGLILLGALEDEDLADLLHVRDEKPNQTDGGGSTASAWNVRTLNTTLTNEISGASLGSNQITLPAGTYFIEASAPAHKVNGHQLRLYNTSDAATAIAGHSTYTDTNDNVTNHSFVTGRFTISAEKVFELQHWTRQTVATSGLGRVANSGSNNVEVEVFADVMIKKLA